MTAISRKCRTLTFVAASATLMFAQAAHAYKNVAVVWNTTKYKNIKCISIAKSGDGNSARFFGVNPKNGFLTTNYKVDEVGRKTLFDVELYDIADCKRTSYVNAKAASRFSVSDPSYKRNTSVQPKYIYVYF